MYKLLKLAENLLLIAHILSFHEINFLTITKTVYFTYKTSLTRKVYDNS